MRAQKRRRDRRRGVTLRGGDGVRARRWPAGSGERGREGERDPGDHRGVLLEKRAATSRPPARSFGHGLARQHLRPHGRVPGEAGDDHGRLHQVVALEALVGVEVGVVRAGLVLDLVLDELEARQADPVEGLVVGAGGVVHRHGRHAEVLERRDPALEDRDDRGVLLGVDAPDLSGPVVDVEVRRELRVLGLRRDRPGRLPEVVGLLLLRVGHRRARREVVRDVGLGAEEPLLLAAPERDRGSCAAARRRAPSGSAPPPS